MNKEEIVNKTADYVKRTLEGEGSGHDWIHVENVWKLAKEIALSEYGSDMFVVELGALLHDIADWKDNNGSLKVGVEVADQWLKKCGVDIDVIGKVTTLMGCISFLGTLNDDKSMTLEAYIVRDADRLEAMGEKAVERTKKFGEKYGVPVINGFLPKLDLTEEEYKNFRRPENSFVNHFFEKLLLLKKGLYTNRAKELGEERHNFMKQYLKNMLINLPINSLGGENVIAYLKLLTDERYV